MRKEDTYALYAEMAGHPPLTAAEKRQALMNFILAGGHIETPLEKVRREINEMEGE